MLLYAIRARIFIYARPSMASLVFILLGGNTMNAQKVYIEQQDLCLSNLIEAVEYKTFVAMPFRNQFSYKSDDVFNQIIKKAIEKANLRSATSKKFATPLRADKIGPNATEITDKIVEAIINSHIFIADFTMANHGVLLEAGIALALKNSKYLIFILQGSPTDVHFDLKDNNFISYDNPDSVDVIANALVESALYFETKVGDQIKTVREKLTPQAVYLLNLYGKLRLSNPANSLHFGQVENDSNLGDDKSIRRFVFETVIRELLAKNLIYLDYVVADDGINPDRYGLHATELGKVFIRKTWTTSLGNIK